MIDYIESIYFLLKEYDSWKEIDEIIAKENHNSEKANRKETE